MIHQEATGTSHVSRASSTSGQQSEAGMPLMSYEGFKNALIRISIHGVWAI